MQYAKISHRDRNNIIHALAYADLVDGSCFAESNIPDLVCPHCGKSVVFRQGNHNKPHFSHLPQTERKKTPNQSESAIHRKSKQAIYRLFKDISANVKTEVRLAGGRRRADILVVNQQMLATIAIEVQYSLMTHREITNREEDYAQHNIAVLWLLGVQAKPYQFSSAHLTRLLPFMRLHNELGFYLPYWDERRQQVYIKQLDWLAAIKKQFAMPLSDYYMLYQQNTVTVAAMLPTAEPRTFPKTRPIKNLERHLQRIMHKPNKYEFKLMDQLRINMLSLARLPDQVFCYPQRCLLVEEPLWIVIAHYLIIIYVGPDISPEMIIKKLTTLLTKRLNKFITDELISLWLQTLIKMLKLADWELKNQ